MSERAGATKLHFVKLSAPPPLHRFLRRVHIAAVSGPSTPLLDLVLRGIEHAMREQGHEWTAAPDATTDAFVTTARLHEPVSWREAPLFTGRKRFGLAGKPSTYTFVQVTQAQLQQLLRSELRLRCGTGLRLRSLSPSETVRMPG